MTIKDALISSSIDLAESQILLSHILKKDRLFLSVHSDEIMTEEQENLFFEYVNRRKNGEPLSYIIGKREFYGREFAVSEHTLIPRPETELIIDESKKLFGRLDSIKILDLCTGSGCIGITLSCEFPFSRVVCSDISSKALNCVSENICAFTEKYNLGGRWIDMVRSDMFDNVPKEKYNLIVSNPPYIPTDDIKDLDQDVQREPKIALDGGKDGLDFYRIIFEKSKDYLADRGVLIAEIGYNQSDEIKKLAKKYDYACRFAKDLQGYERTAVLKLL